MLAKRAELISRNLTEVIEMSIKLIPTNAMQNMSPCKMTVIETHEFEVFQLFHLAHLKLSHSVWNN